MYILMLWVLFKLEAPFWCYVLLMFSWFIKATKE